MSSTLLIDELPIDVLKIVEGLLTKYDPKKHTYEKLSKDGNLKGIVWLSKHLHLDQTCTDEAMNQAASSLLFSSSSILNCGG